MAPKMAGMPKAKKGSVPSMFSAPSTNATHDFLGREGEHVALVALKSQGDLNGRCAFVGAFDEQSERFEAWLSPMQLSTGSTGGLKVNWTDSEGKATAVRVKPANMQKLNMPGGCGGNGQEFEMLAPAQKVAVLMAQLALYSESSLYKDDKRRSPNVISVFRADHPHNAVGIVSSPQQGIVPPDVQSSQGSAALVIRRELNLQTEGVAGFVYVIASCPRIQMAYRTSIDGDGQAIGGKAGADRYLKQMKSL